MSTIRRPAPEVIEALYELGTDNVTSTISGSPAGPPSNPCDEPISKSQI